MVWDDMLLPAIPPMPQVPYDADDESLSEDDDEYMEDGDDGAVAAAAAALDGAAGVGNAAGAAIDVAAGVEDAAAGAAAGDDAAGVDGVDGGGAIIVLDYDQYDAAPIIEEGVIWISDDDSDIEVADANIVQLALLAAAEDF